MTVFEELNFSSSWEIKAIIQKHQGKGLDALIPTIRESSNDDLSLDMHKQIYRL